MKIIQPVATEQNLSVRARENATTVTLVLRHNLEGTENTYTGITTSYSSGILTVPFTQDISEGDEFNATLKNGASIIWRGRLYATTKTASTFKYFT